MNTSELDYNLPEELIARFPAERRDESRLLRLRKSAGQMSHHVFRELPDLLRPDDLLVMNDTRVFPARLLGRRWPDAGKVEALLLHSAGPNLWWAMVKPGKRIKTGDRLVFAPGVGACAIGAPHRLEAVVESYGKQGGGERLLRFEYEGDWWSLLEKIGHTPLPPYILHARKQDLEHESEYAAKRRSDIPRQEETEVPQDRERYQTVFAGDERASVAAPTAGLHFSDAIFAALDRRGIQRAFLQLHVGAGTFQPIKSDRIEDHLMHEEYIRISAETASAISNARAQGRRIVAIGTTVVRALETAALVTVQGGADFFRLDSPITDLPNTGNKPLINPMSGYTRLLINPGFQFRTTDALLTNFHLPRSTLLLLIDAFAGKDFIRKAYEEAVRERYRFYSYGDCMLVD